MPYKDMIRQKQAQHESYLRNREKVKRGRDNRRVMLRNLVDEIKNGTPCFDCGNLYPPYITDYHHLDPKLKDQSIGKLVSDLRAVDRIIAEIAKCELLCANCHRTREYKGNKRFVSY